MPITKGGKCNCSVTSFSTTLPSLRLLTGNYLAKIITFAISQQDSCHFSVMEQGITV